ncbi:helix-turn-helix domain-containing protein [Nocardioides sp. KR10-350]|uniref:helix-turn-helix domain-containing protein n=1 Tax=Nocardioides cheoyonin TaxID=3156615 RepID=UPI0032B3C5DF
MTNHQHPNQSNPVLLTPAAAAEMMGLTTKTLANWRTRSGVIYTGPPFLRVGQGRGRIRYPLAGVREWLAQQERAASRKVA